MLTREDAIKMMMAIDPDIPREKAEKWLDIFVFLAGDNIKLREMRPRTPAAREWYGKFAADWEQEKNEFRKESATKAALSQTEGLTR